MAFQATDVQKALKGFDYPGTGDQLAAHAQDNGASSDLVAALRGIGREVEGPSGVMEGLKGDLTGSS